MINFFKKLKKVKYSRLNNIDVIVIHDNDTLFIDKYILSPLKVKYYVFEPENEIIINFKIIFHSLRYFIQGNNFYLSYTKGLIKSSKALITLSFVDDSNIVFNFAKSCNIARNFAIQNGKRKRSQMESIHEEYGQNQKKFTLDNYFCYGSFEEEIFTKYNHHVNKFIPVGSFRNSVAQKENNINNKYDICLVSCWKDINFIEDSKNSKLNRYVAKINKQIDDYLLKFISENPFSLVIALNGPKGGKDHNYYKKLFGKKADLIPRLNLSSYNSIYSSNMIISTFSTLVVEAFGLGKKVLFIDYSKERLYSSYKKGVWLLTSKGYSHFEKKIKKIINLKQSEWSNITSKYSEHLMKYDAGAPTYKKIQNELLIYLKNSKRYWKNFQQ